MRIRSTKPEFWRSKRIASVDWEARLVLKGLESYVDDNGVGKDDLALIVTDVFPRDMAANPQDTLLRVQAAVNTLAEAGLVHRYEADGTDLLFVSFWESIQYINRPSKGRLPRPDGTSDYGDSEIGAPLLSPQEDVLSPQSLNRGTGEQGNREQDSSSEVADATLRPEIEELLDYLDARIEANGAKVPTRSKKNRDAARLLLDKDERTMAQVKAAIDYATSDEFWRSNILSMSKLREKYDTLRMRAAQKRPGQQRPAGYPLPGTDEFKALPTEQQIKILEREEIREYSR